MQSLDILIGLVTVYLILGLAVTAIVEGIASYLDVRSQNLESTLITFLNGKLTGPTASTEVSFSTSFLSHPLIASLTRSNQAPSYIPPEAVSQVVISLLTGDKPFNSIIQVIAGLPGTDETNPVKRLLGTLAAQANDDVVVFRKAVETHFDAVMDRASGWVKRRQQNVSFVAALFLALACNVDTIALAKAMSTSPATLVKVLALGEAQTQPPTPQRKEDVPAETPVADQQSINTGEKRSAQELIAELQTAGLPIGPDTWRCPDTPGAWVAKLFGLFISVLAISLGAPFWFDVLQKFMQIRQTGISPREKNKQTNP